MGFQIFAVNRAIYKLNQLEKVKTPKFNAVDDSIYLQLKLNQYEALCTQAEASSFVSKDKCKKLRAKVVALSYRIEVRQKTLEPQADMDHLFQRAATWKKDQLSFGDNAHLSNEEALALLTDQDKESLKELTRYVDYLPHVNLDHFFTWTIRNHQSVDIYVQFPSLVERINRSFLAARVGTWGGLGYVENEGKKDVTMLMESNPVSIVNPKTEVTFKSGYVSKVKSIFNQFKNKNYVEGIYTYFKDEGVVPWDSFAMGEVDENGVATPLDVTKVDWHKGLRMREFLTVEEAKERFNNPEINGTNWGLIPVFTRQTKVRDTYGSHSFMRMAIPREDGSGYDCTYGFGWFTKEYPQGAIDGASYLFCPKEGTMQYPDNNEIYTNRQKKEVYYVLTPEKGAECLESFRQDIEDVQQGRCVFQILRWNCTHQVVKKIKKFAGEEESNKLLINYLALQPPGCMGTLLKVLRVMPGCIQRLVLNILAALMGGFSEMSITKKDGTVKTYCVLDSPSWGEDRADRFPHPSGGFDTHDLVEVVAI
jgi:hypothetical protein